MPSDAPTLNIAARVPMTEAEGPGARYAIWVQGCPLRCPGCCNPQFLEFREAERLGIDEVLTDILAQGDSIEGVTLIGGEPFSQAEALAQLAKMVRASGLSVMAFSGHTLDELRAEQKNQALIDEIDLLVDGPYRRDLHTDSLRWIGSTNQQIHFLSERYRHLGDAWDPEQNTIELRLSNGQLTINGFPHQAITRLNQKQGNH